MQIIIGFTCAGSTHLGYNVSQDPQSDLGVLTGVFDSQSPHSALAQTDGPSDPVELEDFLDNEITAELNDYHIPGAAVSVVKDGQLFFAKGYGHADLQNSKPVVANQTLFMVGSVTKLFTLTALMQLVEQGKLDLDADVNTYLASFQIPATYPQPITLKNLMAHNAGFEDRNVGTIAQSAADIEPLGDYLTHNMPARVRPPGEVTAYSNYGVALAGYVIEQVSGMPFDDYIEANILNPLSMHHTTTRQPVPSNLAQDMSMCYTYADGAYQAGDSFFYMQIQPAGAMRATVTDIANFMIAHLQNGIYGDSRILQNATAEQMHTQLFTNDPRVNGNAHGFWEMNLNSLRILYHHGVTSSFASFLFLLPQQNIGLFVSYNSLGGQDAEVRLLRTFLDRYYPITNPAPPNFSQQAGRFAGSYRATRMAYTTFEKAAAIFSQVDVVANSDGTLLLNGLGNQSKWVQVEPGVFRLSGGQRYDAYRLSGVQPNDTLVFGEDAQGHVTYMFINNLPEQAFEKVPWYENVSFTLSLIVACLAFFMSMLIFLPIRFLMDRRKGEKKRVSSRWARWGRGLSGIFSLLNLLFFVGILMGLGNTIPFLFGVPLFFTVVLSIGLAASALGVVSVVFVVLAWKQRYWSLAGRLHYTLVTLACLAFIWFLSNWNLLGFRF
jgi:CubicO group peptidase (beta-lactamase class C family)